MSPEPVVVITLKEIYEMLVKVATKVETMLEQHNGTIKDVEELRAKDSDHEERLRSLERSRWPLPSLAAILALASFVLTLMAFMQRR